MTTSIDIEAVRIAEAVGGVIDDPPPVEQPLDNVTNLDDIVILKRTSYGNTYTVTINTATATAAELAEVNLSEMERKIFGAVLRNAGYELRKNSLTEQIEWRKLGSTDHADWQEFTKESSAVMWQEIKEIIRGRKGQASLSKTDRTELVEGYIAMHNLKTNPFEDWLDSVPEVAPEGDEFEWLSANNPLVGVWRCVEPEGVNPDDWEKYLVKVGFLPFVWAVAHAKEKSPPIARLAMVLAGPQEIGKSNYLKASLPNRWAGRWHGEMKIHSNIQEMVTMALGRIFVEVSEGVGLTAKSRDIFKSFMSAAEPAYREVYQAHRTQFQRNWFLYMTSNERKPIPYDTSGYTRYLSVNVEEIEGWRDDTQIQDICRQAVEITGNPSIGDMSSYGTYAASYMTVHKQKLWGMAKYLYRRYGSSYLRVSESESRARAIAVGEVVHTTDVDESVMAELECSQTDGQPVEACTIIHLARVLGLADITHKRPPNSKEEHYIERSLNSAGFKKQSRDRRLKVKFLESRSERIDEKDLKQNRRTSATFWARKELDGTYEAMEAAISYGYKADSYLDAVFDSSENVPTVSPQDENFMPAGTGYPLNPDDDPYNV